MKILNIGSCNIDYVYSLHHIVREGETQTADRFETFAGGKGLNQSVAAAKAGGQVYHAGCVGADGAFLRELLSDSGVDVSYLQTVDEKNGHAIIQVGETGQNSIFLYPGSNERLTRKYIDRLLSSFDAGDMVLLQNEVNLVDYIVDGAYERGMTVVLNPSPYNDKIDQIDFHKLSYVILNEVEAKDITGSDQPDAVRGYFAERYPDLRVMLTLGVNGSVFFDRNARLYQPAYRVKAVDTTAAGDTFTGYFVAGIAAGKEMADILKTATAASAIAVSRKGAAPSIPTANEVWEAQPHLSSS